jgi:hypothetical protein
MLSLTLTLTLTLALFSFDRVVAKISKIENEAGLDLGVSGDTELTKVRVRVKG